MFFEYALEPSALSSWERVRFFMDAFGPSKGRFLAEYPRRWKKLVIESLNCPDVERARIVERLIRLERSVFSPRVNAVYDGEGLSWLENAKREHERRPFRAIIANGPHPDGGVLDACTVDVRDELWRVEPGCLVEREPELVVAKLGLLLAAAARVVLIDPYFRADQPAKTLPLVAICKAVNGRASVEVHFSDKKRSYALCMQDAARALPDLLPVGANVWLNCWRERAGGARFHNRYILTDIGGVKFGDGIEEGESGQYDHISILDEPSHRVLWAQHVGATLAFDEAGPPQKFVGTSAQP